MSAGKDDLRGYEFCPFMTKLTMVAAEDKALVLMIEYAPDETALLDGRRATFNLAVPADQLEKVGEAMMRAAARLAHPVVGHA